MAALKCIPQLLESAVGEQYSSGCSGWSAGSWQGKADCRVFAVVWYQQHLDRTQRVIQAWTTRDTSAAKTEATGIRQSIADTDWDTAERRGGLNVVTEKIDQLEQDTPASNGRGRINRRFQPPGVKPMASYG